MNFFLVQGICVVTLLQLVVEFDNQIFVRMNHFSINSLEAHCCIQSCFVLKSHLGKVLSYKAVVLLIFLQTSI